jgi:ribosomal protein S12 methylthiotransferase accessory factor YcaO
MNAAPLTPAARRRWRKIERDFHVRAFGEELARINFLPEKRRKAAVAEMIDHARRKGVKLTRPALGVTL